MIGHTSQVHPAVETSLEMVKILILLALGLASCEKLDRTYLPPPGSKFAGGSPGDLQVPLEPPKETPTTHGQSGRNDGLPTLGNSQVELGISRGIPSENSQDLEISTPAANTPFTYFQNAYNVPTTTTSYAFSQTTTLPPGQSYDITTGPFNPTTGLLSQNPTGYFQTTIRPYPQEQYNQNPNYVQYGPQSTPRPEIVSPGNNPQTGYEYLTPEEQTANIGRPTYAPGTQFEGQYQGQQPTLIKSPGNAIQIPSFVQSIPDSVQYPYGQQPVNILQQGIPSTVSPSSQQQFSNITFGNAVPAPNFGQSYNPQDLIQIPISQRPVNTGQQVIPSTVSPSGSPIQGPGFGSSNSQNLAQYPQDQGSFNIGQQNAVPTTVLQGTSEPKLGITSQYDNNFNIQPFGPYNTPQNKFPGQDTTQFMPGSNIQSNQPTYGQNVYQPNAPGSIISQQNPSPSGRFGDSNPLNGGQNVYNPTTTATSGTALPKFSSFSGIPSSTPSNPSETSYPGGVYSTSTASPVIPYQDTTSIRYKIRPERPQAEADRNAVILNYENVRTPEGYSYSFDTSNGIHADESGVVMDGTKAQGSYSYIGDDGKLYSVIYTADENGFQPRGDHLPTSPPIPEAIQRVIEQAARDRAAGISDDGSYDEAKYGHKKYQGKHHPQDQERIFSNGADIPDMIEHQFNRLKNKQFGRYNNQIKPVSTTEDYEINDYGNRQEDYENYEIINNNNKKQVIDDDTLDSSEGNILTQGGNAGFETSQYPGSQQNTQDLTQQLEGFEGTQNEDFVDGRSDNPSKTNDDYNKDSILSSFKKTGMKKRTMMGRPDENNQDELRQKESGLPQSSGVSGDDKNLFDSRQTGLPSNFANKNNQPSLNPRTEFTTLQPINEETGYQYTRPENKFNQEGNRFPSRLMKTNKATRRPSVPARTTAKPFITPNIYRNDEETEDETDDQIPSRKPVYPASVTSSKYDEGLRPEYGQSTTSDQIIGDDDISYTTVAAPRISQPSSSRRPFYNAQTTISPNQYQDAYDNGSPRVNQKGTIRPGKNGGNHYPSSTTFSTQTPGFASSTTLMPSTFSTTMTPQRTSANNRYQTTARPNFSDKTISPVFSSSMRPVSSRIPSGLIGSTEGLPSTTFRPIYNDEGKTVNKLAPGVKVDGFGRPIKQYNQYNDGIANPSETTDYPLGNNQITEQNRSSGGGRQSPGLNEGINTTFMPGVVRFSQPTTSIPGLSTRRPIPGSNQSTGRVIGEDFSGPKRPQTFDPETGYHYK